ncbi:GPI mannosyltransferase 1 [Toxorhynchites rutilus septentrionalis]|uniref:GPI mannosyltransferase 1 n=1 Tax=Toxorhynchites rutilus septentrionalis TaxID=329112 RepID=UPI0024794007|nr:GPI mannosyltransferase 1 [Toxorhynchites rutilus septentrionalis]
MMSFKKHLIISIAIRIFLVYYGEVQDSLSDVQYTDVDYRVVTDGASHVLNLNSPFKRHTYRYTPLLAYLVLPNLLIHQSFGKFIFSLFDLLIGVLIKWILLDCYRGNKISIEKKLLKLESLNNRNKYLIKRKNEILNSNNESLPPKYIRMTELSAYFWLYNPLTMVIATRGNGDCVSCSLVLIALYFMLRNQQTIVQYFLAGVFLGLSIHFRLYPVGFCLAFFLATYDKPLDTVKDYVRALFKPNIQQLALAVGTIVALAASTAFFYFLYGYQFIYESILYHLVRKDTRHNFSLYFYLQYLSSNHSVSLLEKIFTFLPQLILIVMLTVRYGKHRQTLGFSLFTIAFVMVTYNPVVTSQYFVWFLSLLPLSVKNFKNIGIRKAVFIPVMWCISQGGWLLPAYLLEYKGWNTFEFIWIQSIVFFFSNILILQVLISNYDVSYNYKID